MTGLPKLDSSVSSASDLFFGVSIKFFQSSEKFKVLLERLQQAQKLFSDADIEASNSFKADLSEIRRTWKKFQEAEVTKAKTAALTQQKDQIAISVLEGKVAYTDLSPEDAMHTFDFVVSCSTKMEHPLQQSAASLLVKLQFQSQQLQLANQQQILEGQGCAAETQKEILEGQVSLSAQVDEVLIELKSGQRSLDIQALINRNAALIKAEVERRINLCTLWERFKGGTQLSLNIYQSVQDDAHEIAELFLQGELELFSFRKFEKRRASEPFRKPKEYIEKFRTK